MLPLLLLALIAAPAPAAAGPLAHVRVVECTPAEDARERLAVFRGAMRRVPGASRMWVRFTLQERTDEGRWRSLRAPGLGVWRKSRVGVRRFAHRQRVVGLPPGSVSRVLVRYRWYSADGRLLHRAMRRSGRCFQPGTLADLRVVRITAKALEGGPVHYVVQVRNRGSLTARNFGVSLAVDGKPPDTRTVDRLGPGELARVSFFGSPCGVGVEGRADTADVVRESDEADNSLSAPCPGP